MTDEAPVRGRAGMSEKERAMTDPREALVALVEEALGMIGDAWDDGNGVGLDGWVGPSRGAGEVDQEAQHARTRLVHRSDAALTQRLDAILAAGWTPPTVKPSVEDVRDEIAGHPIGGGYYSTTVGVDEATEIARAVLALLPGRAEAEVKAEALREVADWLAGMVGESGPGSRATGYGRAGLDIIARIRDRAARIEKEAEHG